MKEVELKVWGLKDKRMYHSAEIVRELVNLEHDQSRYDFCAFKCLKILFLVNHNNNF